MLTQVTNDFDAPIYDFSIPAYTQYQGMGAAYRNTGLSFTLSSVSKSGSPNEYQFTSSLADGLLCPGDELLLYSNSKLISPIAKAVYTGNETESKIIFGSSDSFCINLYGADNTIRISEPTECNGRINKIIARSFHTGNTSDLYESRNRS